MNPSDPPPPADPSLQDLLLDALRDELSPRERRATEARLEADPALRAEQERLSAFLAATRQAYEVAPDPEAALRIATRVREQVGAAEARARRESLQSASSGLVASAGALVSRRRLAWGRILAVSVALHVLVLGFLAFHVIEQAQEDRSRFLNARFDLPAAGTADDERPWDPIPAPWEGDTASQPVEPDADRIQRMWETDGEGQDLAPLGDLGDHPRHVALEMVVRRHAALKRVRLDEGGLDATGTLRRVERGLKALAARQGSNGSFAAGGNRSAVGETALALLPFLGDGHGSRTGARGSTVVAPGVAWLRTRLFWSQDAPDARTGESPADLGIALRALSEDYVLSYGHLTPGDARRRAGELRLLAARVQDAQAENGAFPGSNDDLRAAVWPMWGLEAAVRTGAVAVPREVPERFRGWYATNLSEDPQVAAAGLLFARPLKKGRAARAEMQATVMLATVGAANRKAPVDPFFALTAGSGLLLTDAGAFRTWNEGYGDRLGSALGPTGSVLRGDPVGDTALVLLALQAAYRTY